MAEFQKLKKSQPRVFTYSLKNENCDWGNYVYHSKNCYMCFDATNCEDCFYVHDSYKCIDCLDCNYCVECELCCQCQDCYKCFNSTYLDDCSRIQDSRFCINCSDLSYCFGCFGLTHKKYCIFNKQFTKKEYFNKLRRLKALPVEEVLKKLAKLRKRYPKVPQHAFRNQNCDYGDYIYSSKNCYFCFDVFGSQDCGYLYDTVQCRNCYEMAYSYDCELSYECVDSAHLYNCNFITYSDYCNNSEHLFNCDHLKDCFGCVGIDNTQYCILNRQFKKEEYFKKVKEIKDGLFGRV